MRPTQNNVHTNVHSFAERFTYNLMDLFKKEANEILEEEVRLAEIRLGEKLREHAANCVLRISKFCSVQHIGDQIQIIVQMKEGIE